ncbi:MAG: hypothetical protein AAF721_20175, partial [Myxococcota bacterium]
VRSEFAGGEVRRWELIGVAPMTSALRRGAAGGGERVVRLRNPDRTSGSVGYTSSTWSSS